MVIFWARCCIILFFKKKIRVALESRTLIWVPLLRAMTLKKHVLKLSEYKANIISYPLIATHCNHETLEKNDFIFLVYFRKSKILLMILVQLVVTTSQLSCYSISPNISKLISANSVLTREVNKNNLLGGQF